MPEICTEDIMSRRNDCHRQEGLSAAFMKAANGGHVS